MSQQLRHALYEFVLSVLLIFAAVSAIRWLALPGSPIAIADPALLMIVAGFVFAHLICLLMYSPLGRRSGGHMHPGVTLFVWLTGGISGSAVVPYIVAQLAGSVAGTALARLVWGTPVEMIGYGAVRSAPGWTDAMVFVAEVVPIVVIFLVVAAVLGRPTGRRFIPVVIGVGVGVSIALLGLYSGASLNPVRQFGPALLSGDLDHLWVYLVAPVVGPVLVGLALRRRLSHAAEPSMVRG